MHPVVVSRVTDEKLAWKPISYLSRVNEEVKTLDAESLHRVRVGVIGTKMPTKGADAIKNCVFIYDSKTGKSRFADEKSSLKNKNESFILSIPLYVKDFSTLHGN